MGVPGLILFPPSFSVPLLLDRLCHIGAFIFRAGPQVQHLTPSLRRLHGSGEDVGIYEHLISMGVEA